MCANKRKLPELLRFILAVFLSGSDIRNQGHLYPIIGSSNAIPFKGGYVLVSRWIGHMGAAVKVRYKFDAYTTVV